MNSFHLALEDCAMKDLGYRGQWFTWERGHFEGSIIRERLDRAVANNDWKALFINHRVDHLVHSFSDYFPLLLYTDIGGRQQRVSHFKFEASWLMKASCESEVHR